ncbi:hypothetical protein JCM17092_29240 [Haloplanus litoreus]
MLAGDCSLQEAVDCTVVEEAKRYTVAQWAAIRGVTEDAVRSNINSAREKLLAEEDRELSEESPRSGWEGVCVDSRRHQLLLIGVIGPFEVFSDRLFAEPE